MMQWGGADSNRKMSEEPISMVSVKMVDRYGCNLNYEPNESVVLRLQHLGVDGTAESPAEMSSQSDAAEHLESVREKTSGGGSAHAGWGTQAEPLTAGTRTPPSRESQRGAEKGDLPAAAGLQLEEASADGHSESRMADTQQLTYTSPSPVGSTGGTSAVKRPTSQATGTCAELDDGEIRQTAREKGCVSVVFPGTVVQDSRYKFVCEIIKCVLYQRQQLPMMYDQLVFYQRRQQAASQVGDVVVRRPAKTDGWDWRKCQRTLQEVEEVLQQLENLFSLSQVPRVLLLLGGTIILPKELYEVNMEALVAGAGGGCSLRTTPCLRQLFRTLFVADILSDARPVRLMATTVMVLAHRDCGVGWFRPKLNYRVPAQVKRRVISLSSDPTLCGHGPVKPADWEDYVWFQAPVTIKGFCK